MGYSPWGRKELDTTEQLRILIQMPYTEWGLQCFSENLLNKRIKERKPISVDQVCMVMKQLGFSLSWDNGRHIALVVSIASIFSLLGPTRSLAWMELEVSPLC